MTTPSNDYSKTIIYKIICDDLPEYVYVGSTTNFTKRKSYHKSNCNNETCKQYNFKLYQTIRENGGFENWKMIEIEKFPECVDKRDAERREQKWIDELKSNLNMIKAFQSEEDKKEYKKKYQIENAEHIKKQHNEYDATHKEDKKIYREINKDSIAVKKKIYYIENAEHILERERQRYFDNKEQIQFRLKEKITCECGAVICRNVLARHKKTAKHLTK